MACYIASNDNRYYGAVEASFGAAPAVTGASRIPAVKLAAAQLVERPERRDKMGSRTFTGVPGGLRKRTQFELKTYLMSWTNPTAAPSIGALLEGALGGGAKLFAGGTVAATPGPNQVRFTGAHGLSVGQAITFGGELRFVAAVPDVETVELNVPFTATPSAGATVGATASYEPARQVRSLSLFDYWSPETAVHRIVTGAAVDKMRVRVNGDFHEFEFEGPAADLIDSVSFASGQGALSAFPPEPLLSDFQYQPIPGHLGQAWLGAIPERFYTLTGAEFTLDNDIDLRSREFGSMTPRCVVAGERKVTMNFSLFEQDDEATRGLYEAAKQRSPVSVMLQLGQQAGQLFGIFVKSVVPEVPEFDDRETRLQWRFENCRAQGTLDDEVYMAFG